MTKRESIYKYINSMSAKYPRLPYVFQDPYTAGWWDVTYVLFDDNLSFAVKEKLAIDVMNQIVMCVENQSSIEELRDMLCKHPIMLYLSNINNRIKLYISEKLIDAKSLYSFGIKLTTQGELEEEVKLGMLILGAFENDLVRQILRTLGLHSTFTLYALIASSNFNNQNQFIYELAKGTCGYGKLISIHLLKPVLEEQKEWMFEKGYKNEVSPNISAIMCMEKADMFIFYQELILTRDNFSNLAYLLTYSLENNSIMAFSNAIMLAEKYLDFAKKHASTFIDLAATVMIENSIFIYWEELGEAGEKQNPEDLEREVFLKSDCNMIINQPKWELIVMNELVEPKEQTSIIIQVLDRMGIVPEFWKFTSLLERDPFDMDILRFTLIENSEEYFEEVLQYLYYVLPEEVMAEGPQIIDNESITVEHRPDIWLACLLKVLQNVRYYEEDLFINCLTCRFPDVRIEAIRGLSKFKLNWSERVIPALKHAYEIEPIEDIKRQLLDLIEDRSSNNKKQCEHVDISQAEVAPSELDVFLLDTKIAGIFYRDVCVVEDKIQKGDILYLVREPDNKYDEKAIQVTTKDGYVLGYIPKVDNIVLANLMDSGERLYAVLLSEDITHGKPDIKIMLSKVME